LALTAPHPALSRRERGNNDGQTNDNFSSKATKLFIGFFHCVVDILSNNMAAKNGCEMACGHDSVIQEERSICEPIPKH
jgi:hypothetical protein